MPAGLSQANLDMQSPSSMEMKWQHKFLFSWSSLRVSQKALLWKEPVAFMPLCLPVPTFHHVIPLTYLTTMSLGPAVTVQIPSSQCFPTRLWACRWIFFPFVTNWTITFAGPIYLQIYIRSIFQKLARLCKVTWENVCDRLIKNTTQIIHNHTYISMFLKCVMDKWQDGITQKL